MAHKPESKDIEVKFYPIPPPEGETPVDERYPEGFVIDLAVNRPGCRISLPYKTEGRGVFHVRCLKCGIATIIPVRGREDDPRSVILPCVQQGRGATN